MKPHKFFCYCLHCERPWDEGSGHFEGEEEYCPRADCNGGPADTRSWEWVRQSHPEYPLVPRCSEIYPIGQHRVLC